MKIIFLTVSIVLIALGIFGLSKGFEVTKSSLSNIDSIHQSANEPKIVVYPDPNPF
ncbi:MAG: hypothetical protein HY015_02695, partial [Bacteroidetes bacterium]|nr:hypothetical protein [Bacteroidota bacterium]